MVDYKEKIKKLLALATSPEENEAKAALLKARKLMAQYKISEMELDIKPDAKIIKVNSGIGYSIRGEFWIGQLSMIIAQNYCCKVYCAKETQQKMFPVFVGFEEDANLCNAVFSYAVESARRIAEEKLRKDKFYPFYTTKEKNIFKKSMCLGFSEGIRVAFENQNRENVDETGWGLVVVTDPKVNEFYDNIEGLHTNKYKGKGIQINGDARNVGFEEGKNFSPNRVID